MITEMAKKSKSVIVAVLLSTLCLFGSAVAMDEAKMLETYGKAVVLIASYN